MSISESDTESTMTREIDGATSVLERTEALAEFFEAQAREAEDLGRLPLETVQQLKASGLVRLLQPREYGGYEAHPTDFAQAVINVGSRCGSSGWVAGVVGVHPHGLAMGDPRILAELWGEDPDVWTSSPYAPMGLARPVEGGFRFSGHWKFSSGTDASDWVIIGGLWRVRMEPPTAKTYATSCCPAATMR
ncbi:MAG: acyl-CoA dehydrogenase family protein [Arthrobacter sp.]